MSWRPDDWKTPYTNSDHEWAETDVKIFEAGADAMLEAIKAMGSYTPKVEFSGGIKLGGGWSIYLPDDIDGVNN